MEDRTASSSNNSSFPLDTLKELGACIDKFDSQSLSVRTHLPDVHQKEEDVSSKSLRADRQASDVGIALDLAQSRTLYTADQLVAAIEPLLQSSASQSTSAQATQENAQYLETLRLARVTYAALALTLEDLLKGAQHIADQAWYWTDIDEDPKSATMYLLQTLPVRIVSLLNVTAQTLVANARDATASIRSSSEASSVPSSEVSRFNRQTLVEAWRLVRDSPSLAIEAVFPEMRTSATSSTTSSSEGGTHPEANTQNASELATSSSSRKLRPSHPLRLKSLSPLYLTRHEARAKRARLMTARDDVATHLGRLAQAASVEGLHAQAEVGHDGAGVQESEAAQYMLQDLQGKIQAIWDAVGMDAVSEDPARSVSVSNDDRAPPLPILGTDAASPALVLAQRLHKVLSTIPRTRAARLSLLSPSPVGCSRPSLLVRLWPSLVAGPIATYFLFRTLARNYEGIVATIRDAEDTIRGFWNGWVIEPARNLVGTIRHGESAAAGIVTKESLTSDLESLQRMVVDFTNDTYSLSSEQAAEVASKVKDGDLTYVLKVYEAQMKSPFKSAVSGSLIRTLLIQVQKAKVDLEVAMSGIDRLLKSQELLFGAVGIAPAMGILWLGWTGLKGVLFGVGKGGGKRRRELRMRAWEEMRNIDRLLSSTPSQSSSSPSTLSPLTHGLLLLSLSTLRSASYPLVLSSPAAQGRKGAAQRLHRLFLEDVRDLERGGAGGASAQRSSEGQGQGSTMEVGIGWMTRRVAVERMWRLWGGVLGGPERA